MTSLMARFVILFMSWMMVTEFGVADLEVNVDNYFVIANGNHDVETLKRLHDTPPGQQVRGEITPTVPSKYVNPNDNIRGEGREIPKDALSKLEIGFFAVFNGRYKTLVGGNDVSIILKPVELEDLTTDLDLVIYVEVSVNDTTIVMLLAVPEICHDGQSVCLTFYKFTDPIGHKPGTFDTENLDNFDEKIILVPGCNSSIGGVATPTILFSGNDTACEYFKHGEYKLDSIVGRCENLIFNLKFQDTQNLPITLVQPKDKFDLEMVYQDGSVPSDFNNPCDRELRNTQAGEETGP